MAFLDYRHHNLKGEGLYGKILQIVRNRLPIVGGSLASLGQSVEKRFPSLVQSVDYVGDRFGFYRNSWNDRLSTLTLKAENLRIELERSYKEKKSANVGAGYAILGPILLLATYFDAAFVGVASSLERILPTSIAFITETVGKFSKSTLSFVSVNWATVVDFTLVQLPERARKNLHFKRLQPYVISAVTFLKPYALRVASIASPYYVKWYPAFEKFIGPVDKVNILYY